MATNAIQWTVPVPSGCEGHIREWRTLKDKEHVYCIIGHTNDCTNSYHMRPSCDVPDAWDCYHLLVQIGTMRTEPAAKAFCEDHARKCRPNTANALCGQATGQGRANWGGGERVGR